MTITFNIWTLLIWIPNLIFGVSQFNVNHFKTYSENRCGFFKTKSRNDALFQDVKVLSLNCDSTFHYRHSNCIKPETSAGTWSLSENTISLSVTDKVKRLAVKATKNKSNEIYIDLSGTQLTIYDSIVIWKRSDKLTDTLYRQ